MTTSARAAVLAAVAALQACSSANQDLTTVAVVREPISQFVTASGTLSPQDTILVGSQVSGTIQNIYVDYNSQVRTGQVLARLDPSTFQAQLDQAKATLAQLQAQSDAAASAAAGSGSASLAAGAQAQSQRELIVAADEDVRKAQSALALAQLTLHRDRTLLSQGYVAQNVVDADVTNAAAARDGWVAAQTAAKTVRHNTVAGAFTAGSASAQATGAAATQRASSDAVLAAEASVRQAGLNLDHSVITSPVSGTVIARNVSVGQTVAAALQAPTLFTIAKDLRKMELDIAVGEPDVGSVAAGQTVAFTVLAYPGRSFVARVNEVRQNPTVTNNVTTYDAVAFPNNADGALRPGMTANVKITVATYPNSLVVPLAALQWRPSAAVRKKYGITIPDAGKGGSSAKHSAWGATGGSAEFAVSVGSTSTVYLLAANGLRAVGVVVAAIDGTRVGVVPSAGGIDAGDTVVTDDALPQAPASAGP